MPKPRGRPAKAPRKRTHAEVDVTKGDATRERIRQAVIRLVSRKGLNNIILQDVCREADITHGGFYFHFESKEDAMLDVAREWITEFKGNVLKTPYLNDFYEEIYQMILAYVRGYVANIEVTRLVFAVDREHPEVGETFTRHQRRWWARLEELFTRVRLAAGLPTGMEAWIAQSVTASIEGVCVNTFLVGLPELVSDGVEPERVAEREAIIWHRSVLGRDPDPARLKFMKTRPVASKT
jgi:AcrR family transcriptional regulator